MNSRTFVVALVGLALLALPVLAGQPAAAPCDCATVNVAAPQCVCVQPQTVTLAAPQCVCVQPQTVQATAVVAEARVPLLERLRAAKQTRKALRSAKVNVAAPAVAIAAPPAVAVAAPPVAYQQTEVVAPAPVLEYQLGIEAE